MATSADQVDVAVIGGGLGGLTAAAFAARAGSSVRLFDARSEIGGRARTVVDKGFSFNEGAHALYKASEGSAVLRELGIRPKGGSPAVVRTRLSLDGRLRRSPGVASLRQFVRFGAQLGRDRQDPGLVQISAQEWIDGRLGDPGARQLAAAAVRLSSYSGDLSTFSADAAAAQLHLALRGVTYLHGGWAQLVGALREAAVSGGAAVDPASKVLSIDGDGGRYLVGIGDGQQVLARAVVIAAGGPGTASRLLGGRSASLAAAAAAALPVHAACLDLGLRSLPKPSVRFVLGLDKPTYANVHTPGAHLAEHGHLLHLMVYESDERSAANDVDVDDLECLADEVQPGWRDEEDARQLGLRRVVAFDRPRPGLGLVGRPPVTVDDAPGVFVAGDWVGPTDLLGSAAMTSGKAAGLAAVRHLAGVHPTHS